MINKSKITLLFLFISFLFISCKTTQIQNKDEVISEPITIPEPALIESETKNQITLMFGGDIMAHNVNYQISSYDKIYRDITDTIKLADLAFANIEAPVDTTKEVSSYPNFNMNQEYVESAIDAGFSVFSLCNNHSNDQGLDGIKNTIKTTALITEKYNQKNIPVYFSGLKEKNSDSYTYNVIKKNGWNILFLPMTELLNRPDHSKYINYIGTSSSERNNFIQYVKKLREENPCDLFILSFHTAETEYIRTITDKQRQFYYDLLDAGIDILWANHAHLIKDRQFVYNASQDSQKLIMFANGNTISGQRRSPDFDSAYPDYERDNTGDGLLYFVTLEKQENKSPRIKEARPYFITTYINTAYEFVIKPLNQDFIDYLYDVPRKNWAEYIKRRIIINKEKTKDLIVWQ